MAPKPDPRVTDLRRYRRERERARRTPPRPKTQREPLLGGRPRAGLILVLVIAVLAALWLLQHLR